MNCPNQ